MLQTLQGEWTDVLEGEVAPSSQERSDDVGQEHLARPAAPHRRLATFTTVPNTSSSSAIGSPACTPMRTSSSVLLAVRLDHGGAARRLDDATERGEHAVAGGLDLQPLVAPQSVSHVGEVGLAQPVGHLITALVAECRPAHEISDQDAQQLVGRVDGHQTSSTILPSLPPAAKCS